MLYKYFFLSARERAKETEQGIVRHANPATDGRENRTQHHFVTRVCYPKRASSPENRNDRTEEGVNKSTFYIRYTRGNLLVQQERRGKVYLYTGTSRRAVQPS